VELERLVSLMEMKGKKDNGKNSPSSGNEKPPHELRKKKTEKISNADILRRKKKREKEKDPLSTGSVEITS